MHVNTDILYSLHSLLSLYNTWTKNVHANCAAGNIFQQLAESKDHPRCSPITVWVATFAGWRTCRYGRHDVKTIPSGGGSGTTCRNLHLFLVDLSLVSPGFLYLHASSLSPVNVFHRRHNTTGNNGGGQIKRTAKRMADTRKHRPWKLNLKRCVFGMSTRTSKIEIPAGFCRANNWTVSTTTRERWRAKLVSRGNARQSVRVS